MCVFRFGPTFSSTDKPGVAIVFLWLAVLIVVSVVVLILCFFRVQ